MERKIGEIFPYNGEWYQCMKGNTCNDCAFYRSSCGSLTGKGSCRHDFRGDATNVIFKKLEKVGEPFSDYCPSKRVIYFQRYKCYQKPIIEGNIIWHWADDTLIDIDIEIKQKQEDMKEKNLNLKPFDLEAAKAGKSVCTRDGRKARIICFNAEGNKPLIVLSNINDKEVILRYTKKGQSDNFHSTTPREDDLMMLPEKKEGWVNVYKTFEGGRPAPCIASIYPTKEDAERSTVVGFIYVDTVPIAWRE